MPFAINNRNLRTSRQVIVKFHSRTKKNPEIYKYLFTLVARLSNIGLNTMVKQLITYISRKGNLQSLFSQTCKFVKTRKSSVPPSFGTTGCKSTWSLSNNERLHKKRCALAKGNIHRPRSANQRSCLSSTKTMGKVYFQSKKQGVARIIQFSMFYLTVKFQFCFRQIIQRIIHGRAQIWKASYLSFGSVTPSLLASFPL